MKKGWLWSLSHDDRVSHLKKMRDDWKEELLKWRRSGEKSPEWLQREEEFMKELSDLIIRIEKNPDWEPDFDPPKPQRAPSRRTAGSPKRLLDQE